MKTKSVSGTVFNMINYTLLILLTLVTIYPVLYVLFASLSKSTDLLSHDGLLLYPLSFQLKGYEMVFKHPLILRSYWNTLCIVGSSLALNMILTAIAAYVLSRKSLKYRGALMVFIVFTMYFSGGLIPNYLNIKGFGLANTIWAIVLPGAISTFNLIIMKNYFESIPENLEESAKIDGANEFIIMFKIILPLSKSILAVVALYYAVSHWNAWFNAMIFLQDRDKFPLQLILREILLIGDSSNAIGDVADASELRETLKYATIIVATVPILCVYPFLQKYFVKGTLVGAVKG